MKRILNLNLDRLFGGGTFNRRKAACVFTAVCISASFVTGCSGREYLPAETVSSGRAAARNSGGERDKASESAIPETSQHDQERAMAPAIAFTDISDTVYIKGMQVRLRTAPTTADAGNIAAVLNTGAPLTRTGDSEEWCRVSYQGQTLYVSKSLITTQAIQPAGAANAAGSAAGGNSITSGTGTVNADKTQISDGSPITLDSNWKYADASAIKTGSATMYRSAAASRKEITVCVNAGHGTSGGESVKTLCHPDGTPKVTGGTTGAGATKAIAVSSGMTFSDGTPEAKVTLALAQVLKDKLLANGYDVVMIRESDDVQLDNVARTVIANNTADCHIALHWDSTTNDKGAFYMSVPDVASYRAMEPVASNWQKHNALGENLISGLRSAGVKIFSGGSMAMDLTQTSYSTVPSIDIELGDKGSDHSAGTLDVLANGLLAGINSYFGK